MYTLDQIYLFFSVGVSDNVAPCPGSIPFGISSLDSTTVKSYDNSATAGVLSTANISVSIENL